MTSNEQAIRERLQRAGCPTRIIERDWSHPDVPELRERDRTTLEMVETALHDRRTLIHTLSEVVQKLIIGLGVQEGEVALEPCPPDWNEDACPPNLRTLAHELSARAMVDLINAREGRTGR